MKKALIAIITIGFIAFSTMAFAGMGYGKMGYCGKGSYGHHGMMQDDHCPMLDSENLSKEDKAALESEFKRFKAETKEIRRSIYTKQLELKGELAKKEFDLKAAKKLQKEISDLESTLGEKRIEHISEVKKINPDAGFMGRGFKKGRKGGCPMQ